jgi:hypothetical protein
MRGAGEIIMNSVVHDTIVKMVTQSPDPTIPLLSAITAILAIIIGPSIQWYIAKRQIKAASNVATQQIEVASAVATQQIEASLTQGEKSISSAERQILSQQRLAFAQGWIVDVRKLTADYIIACTDISRYTFAADTLFNRMQVEHVIIEAATRAMQLQFQIEVILTSSEMHQQYTALLKNLFSAARVASDQEGADAYDHAKNAVVEAARKLIEEERESVTKPITSN